MQACSAALLYILLLRLQHRLLELRTRRREQAADVARVAVPDLLPRTQERRLHRRAREARRVGLLESVERGRLHHATADGADDGGHEREEDDWLPGRPERYER